MIAAPNTVRTAQPDDRDAVALILAEAFLDGDLAPWLVASDEHRRDIYPGYFAMIAEHALEHGHVEVTDDAAAAVWYVIGEARQVPPIDGYAARLADLTGPYLSRFRAVDEAMTTHHPTEAHHYLAYLAVRPGQQRRGHGTRLLNHHRRRLDTDSAPAYLEATSPQLCGYYGQHGYRLLRPTFPAGRHGPLLYPMWRQPIVCAHP